MDPFFDPHAIRGDVTQIERGEILFNSEKYLEFENSPFSDKESTQREFYYKYSSGSDSQTYLSASSEILGSEILDFDSYRNGIQINNFKHWSTGLAKIYSGLPGHMAKPLCYGENTSQIVEENYFKDLEALNPVSFIAAQSKEGVYFPEDVLSYPLVISSDSNQKENYNQNGIIEPFPIRSVISRFSINFPFEPHGIRADMSAGNSFMLIGSEKILNADYFDTNVVNEKYFLDADDSDILLTEMLGGLTGSFLKTGVGFFNDSMNKISPFEDLSLPRGEKINTLIYEPEMIEVIGRMPQMQTTYLSQKEKSSCNGFVYDNVTNPKGTDSIAFGGYIY